MTKAYPRKKTEQAEAPEAQLAGFLAKFSPEIAALSEAIRARLPNAVELVYDNYNALAVGFGPTNRASKVILSIAIYPRWISLFFLQAKGLPDPGNILKGSGNKARHIVLPSAETLDDPLVVELMAQALERAIVPLDPATEHRLIIKSISAKQRPRRPAESKARK